MAARCHDFCPCGYFQKQSNDGFLINKGVIIILTNRIKTKHITTTQKKKTLKNWEIFKYLNYWNIKKFRVLKFLLKNYP